MSTHILWLVQLCTIYVSILLCYKFWRREGLLFWSVVAVILANIQVVKLISLFGMDATLGNTLYVSSFFATDALSEFYGKKEARKAMHLSLLAAVLFLVFGKFAAFFPPSPVDMTGHEALVGLFSFAPRVILASFVCFWLSQTADIHYFHKYTQQNRPLWFKNLLSTSISQLIDSFLFVFIAFLGVFEGTLLDQLPIIMQIGLSTYLIKMIVNVLDIPFLYLLRSMHQRMETE
ncbi:MAG: queuosine precursor transporter [Brevinema sp.]